MLTQLCQSRFVLSLDLGIGGSVCEFCQTVLGQFQIKKTEGWGFINSPSFHFLYISFPVRFFFFFIYLLPPHIFKHCLRVVPSYMSKCIVVFLNIKSKENCLCTLWLQKHLNFNPPTPTRKMRTHFVRRSIVTQAKLKLENKLKVAAVLRSNLLNFLSLFKQLEARQKSSN